MDLHGWDTAYAVRVSRLHAALAAPGMGIDSFEAEADGWTMHGQLKPWRIVPGGAGTLLHLEVPIARGSLCGPGSRATDLNGISVLLEINLQLLPSSTPGQQALRFHFAQRGTPGLVSPTGSVTPLKVLNGDQLSFIQQAMVAAGLADSLIQQAPALAFSFASISVVPPGTPGSWLTPRSCAYAYTTTEAGEGFLVIYGVTDDRDISALPREVDPALVSGPGDATYAISTALFMAHVIQPVLPQVYAGTDASTFTFNAAELTVRNTRPISIGDVQSGAITYHPQIQSLAITTSGSRIDTRVEGECDMYMGMSLTFTINSHADAQFDPARGALSLLTALRPEVTHSAHIPWYDYLMGPLADIIMAIVVPLVADGIASGLTSALQDMTFSNAGPQNVHWAGMTTFTIQGGELNTAFRLWGQLG